LCPRIGGTLALQLAEELRNAVAAIELADAPADLAVTISIGVALFDGNRCHDVGSWLRTADGAMYAAKARGRDQIVVAQAVNELLAQVGPNPQLAD
jgi:diguanylate cyclase (GGDEF)-like protein